MARKGARSLLYQRNRDCTAYLLHPFEEARQRQLLQAWLTRLVDSLHGRIHGFNVSVAQVWAEEEHVFDKVGRRMPIEDSHIAATARRRGLTTVTGKRT